MKLWEKMDGDRIWLENPRRRRRRKNGRKRRRSRRGRFVKGSAAAKRYMASIRLNRGKRRRKRRGRRNYGVMPVLNKGRHMARRKRGRRHFRRNPGGFSVSGIMGKLKRGVVDALWVTAGEAGAGIIPSFFPSIPSTGVAGFVVTGLTAVGLGEVARRFMKNSRAAEFVVAGALAKPIRALAVGAGIPRLTAALSSYPLMGYPDGARTEITGGALGGVPGSFVEGGEAETVGVY